MLVWRWYWVDQRYTASPYWGKLLLAKSELFDGSDDGAALIVYARYDNNPAAAEQTMQDFVHAMLPALTTRLEDAYRERP